MLTKKEHQKSEGGRRVCDFSKALLQKEKKIGRNNFSEKLIMAVLLFGFCVLSICLSLSHGVSQVKSRAGEAGIGAFQT